MQRILKNLGVFVFIGLISLTSCEKDKEIIPLPLMKATIDGVEWNSIFRLSVMNSSVVPANIVITGTPSLSQTADKTIILTIKGIDAGTYNLSPGTLTAQCLVVYKKTSDAAENSGNYFTSTVASITISKIDTAKKQLSGSFSATLYAIGVAQPVVINNGTFENLNYQVN